MASNHTNHTNFTDQILYERLAKLNNSQQSIETLSHWCIFHRKRAKQVVDIWEKDFLGAPNERRVSFLYLANDILQNSRKKGPEFVNEFWRVLPGLIKDAIDKGEENLVTVVKRLVAIWEQRKVFGNKEIKGELLPELSPPSPAVVKQEQTTVVSALKLPGTWEKAVAQLQAVEAAAQEDEDALTKFNEVINEVHSIERLLEDRPGSVRGPQLKADLKRHQGTLRRCIERLEAAEARRSALVSSVQELLSGQESHLERIQTQLQMAQSQAEQAATVEQRVMLRTTNGKPHTHLSVTQSSLSQHTGSSGVVPQPPSSVPSLKRSLSTPKDREPPLPPPRQEASPPPPPPLEQEKKTSAVGPPPGFKISEATRTAGVDISKPTKPAPASAAAAAAEVAAKLAASSSSVSMLSSVLSTLAAESGSASLASALMSVNGPSRGIPSDLDTSQDKRRKVSLDEAVASVMGGGFDSYLSPPPPPPHQLHPVGRSQLAMPMMGHPPLSGQPMMGMQMGHAPPAWTHIPAVPSGPPPPYTPYQPPPPMNYYNPPPSSLQ